MRPTAIIAVFLLAGALTLATCGTAHASGSSFPSLGDFIRAIFAPRQPELPNPVSREEMIRQDRAYRAQQAASKAQAASEANP